MIGRVIAVFHWLSALGAYRRNEHAVALYHVERFESLDQHAMDYHLAFHGTLLVLNHRSVEAAEMFRRVTTGGVAPGYRVIDPAYGRAYSEYYLALIEQTGHASYHRNEARGRPRSSFARRYLPLIDPAGL